MKKGFTILAVLIISKMSAQSIQQPSDIAAIKQVINTQFDAMRKGDSTLLRSVFPKGMLVQISNDKNGKAILSTKSADDLAKVVGTPHPLILDERIIYDMIKIDSDLACVWTPYQFYLGDQFSHCGVNVFQLMRTADGWKVISIAYTKRKENCIP